MANAVLLGSRPFNLPSNQSAWGSLNSSSSSERMEWRGRGCAVSPVSDIETLANQEYKYGFYAEIEADAVQSGLNEGIIRLISAKKNEPDWMLEWRLKSYRYWLKMKEPIWNNIHYPPIDYQTEYILSSSPR